MYTTITTLHDAHQQAHSSFEWLKNLHIECKFFNKLIKIRIVLDWLIEMKQG